MVLSMGRIVKRKIMHSGGPFSLLFEIKWWKFVFLSRFILLSVFQLAKITLLIPN